LDQHLAQARVTGGTGDEGDVRGAVENLFALLLGHAAEDAEDFAAGGSRLAGVALEVLQAIEDLLLGLVANAAGVVENEVGVFGGGDLRIALGHEGADDLFGVVDVHLAAECFEVEGFPRHGNSIVVDARGLLGFRA
jgi:hypothetical protein